MLAIILRCLKIGGIVTIFRVLTVTALAIGTTGNIRLKTRTVVLLALTLRALTHNHLNLLLLEVSLEIYLVLMDVRMFVAFVVDCCFVEA